MRKVLIVAAHPDDETLGCGGVLLRHRSQGDEIHWVIGTEYTPEIGGTPERVASRNQEIDAVARHFGFAKVHRLGFPSARLDDTPRADIVAAITGVVSGVLPDTIYVPFRGDIHSDHAVLADACAAASKWFRHSSIKRVRAYETLSETEFQIAADASPFRPNLFVDISKHIDGKIEAMHIYKSEMGKFPFPRSEEAIRALATLRGSTAGCHAAEAFMTLREIE